MRADPRFLTTDLSFWADVRLISEEVGYTVRGAKVVRVPTAAEVEAAYEKLNLDPARLVTSAAFTTEGQHLHDYFAHRAEVLNSQVESNLMDAADAAALWDQVQADYPDVEAPVPMNKQKGDKRAPAYLTAMVNRIVAAHADGMDVDFDPRGLTSFTAAGQPVRTLARRVDGAFPARVNPVALWEIKEYYYTTTFGSRVADGVYETLLDGTELAETREALAHQGVPASIDHLLFVDSHLTWWEMGRSYLCRIIDMLHMGLVTEAIFGREIIDRLPDLVSDWVARARPGS